MRLCRTEISVFVMRLLLIASLLVLLPGQLLATNRHAEVVEDNDFAEFEESDDGQSAYIH